MPCNAARRAALDAVAASWTIESEEDGTRASASRGRLHAAWRLSLYGLRRSEVLGLRWSDIDLKAKTLTVNQSRVLVEYKVRIEEPKSRNGKRTLPLDDALITALTALHKLQLRESAEAGTAYRAGLDVLDWYRGGEYVITDELARSEGLEPPTF
jgi:integrase